MVAPEPHEETHWPTTQERLEQIEDYSVMTPTRICCDSNDNEYVEICTCEEFEWKWLALSTSKATLCVAPPWLKGGTRNPKTWSIHTKAKLNRTGQKTIRTLNRNDMTRKNGIYSAWEIKMSSQKKNVSNRFPVKWELKRGTVGNWRTTVPMVPISPRFDFCIRG